MPRRPLPRDVRKALDLLEGGAARRLDVPRLAAACGVAPRTLQQHFRSFLGCTPAQYMRELRLQRARRDLLRPAPGASVTRIAARHGFQHFGRFAASYASRYGEPPSATLDRRRKAAVPSIALAMPLAPAGRPAVAVGQFELAGTQAQRFGALAADLRAALCRMPSCIVTGAERARYQVRGCIRGEEGETVRAILFLEDSRTGRRLWADHWSGLSSEIRDIEWDAEARIAPAIQAAILGAEVQRAAHGAGARPGAWELTMRALPYALSFDPELETRAIDLLDRAMDEAPEDALPPAVASWCHGLLAAHHLAPDPGRSRDSASALAARAARLPGSDALVEVFLAGACSLAHDLPGAAAHVDRALRLDGGSAWAWGRSGWVEAYTGRPVEAIERFAIARDLSGGDTLDFLWAIGIGSAWLERGDYARAIEWYRQALAERPSATWNDRFRAAACALAGRKQEAREVLAGFSRAFPGVTIADVRAGLPYSARFLDLVSGGLESAGMRP